ncbi:MAG: alkyl sulfatase dimerization domain-containing protein [Halioglobus sp.]
MTKHWIACLGVAALIGCSDDTETIDYQGFSEPTKATQKHNEEITRLLSLEDQQDFEDATKGLIAADDSSVVRTDAGKLVWDIPSYSFIDGDAPASVNPSLWRQERLNNIRGLFEVVPGVYQLRGFDLSNMTIVEGNTGWIIVDPLTAKETAAHALAFARQHLEAKPIKAILFTHSHIDHFGGALGVASVEEVKQQGIPVIAPVGFMEAATRENIIAGYAMGRRGGYMYGTNLPRHERGHIGSGLGSEPAMGSHGILQPTDIIDTTGETRVIDGVEMVFQNVPGSEAPAEYTFYLPRQKAFMGAELVSRNMHNLYTLRGAHVRDGLSWSKFIDEAISLFGEADVYLGSHHWPAWGNENVLSFLEKQRDTYKYLHDQSVRLLNEGYTSAEIAEQLEMPEPLSRNFATRGYYGTVRHNAKAVYQMYMGWYDGNPAKLNPLPDEQASQRYVQAMGGEEEVLELAQSAFDDGDYRWSAELLNRLVFAGEDSGEARELLASCYDQMGYQAESGPWRNVYLTAAWELRNGAVEVAVDITTMTDVLANTSIDKFFDSMAVQLNGDKARGKELSVEFYFTDLSERYRLEIKNSVLRHYKVDVEGDADAALVLSRAMFNRLTLGQVGITDALFSDDLSFQGSKLSLVEFFGLFDKPTGTFAIVTP